MSYQSLDLKYRPRTFQQVVGQQVAIGTIASMLSSGKLSQTILLNGQTGVGKTTIARMIARYVNCVNGPLDVCSPDKLCQSCRGIDNGNSPNVIEFNAANTRGIDDARELIVQSKYSPAGGANRRIFILDEVHQLSGAAAQALLKPLEEPPAKTMWILCTTEIQKILKTVRGRSLVLTLKPVAVDPIKKLLGRICKEEQRELPEEILKNIAELSDGHVRNAVKMLESTLLYTAEHGSIGVEDIASICEEVVYVSAEAMVERYLQYLLSGSALASVAIRHVQNSPFFIQTALQYLKDLIFAMQGNNDITSEAFNRFMNKAVIDSNASVEDLIHLYELHLAAFQQSKSYEVDALDLLDLVVFKGVTYMQKVNKSV